MAEPQKKSSSAMKSKEKDSLLGDMDFGKDFFSSWGSMNVSGDDVMDFVFGPVAKGKKTAFNFDKIDVDFSLDGDLDKISAFKIDMSDLDISSPLKKSGTKEKSKDGSGDGNHKRKQDLSGFKFDFNELDNFEFEPNFTKEGNKISQKRESEEPSKKEDQGSKPEQRDIISGSGSLDSNFSASKVVTTSKVITTEVDLGKFDFTDHSLSGDSRADDTSKPPTIPKSLEPAQEVTLPEIMSDRYPQEIVPEAIFQEERATRKPYAQESVHELSIKSLSGDQATQITLPEVQMDVSSRATKDVIGETNGKRVSEDSPELEKSLLETQEKSATRLCSDDSERNIYGDNDNTSIGHKDGSEPAHDDVDSADTSSSNTSRKSRYGIESSTEHENGKSEGGMPSPNSKTSRSIEMHEKEIGSVRSKYFKRSAERESHIGLGQSSQAALSMFSAEHQTGRRDIAVSKDAQETNKVIGISDSVSGEMTKSETEPECGGTVRGVKGIGASLPVDLLTGNKSAGFPRLGDKEKGTEGVSESKDAQPGSKDVRISDSISREMTKNSGEPETARTLRGLKDSGESSTDSLLNGNKLAGFSRLSDKGKTIEVSESKDAQRGNKEVIISDSVSREMTKNNGETENARTVRALKDIGKSLNPDGSLNGSKLVSSSRLSFKEMAKEETVQRLEKNAKHLVTLREVQSGSKSAVSSSLSDKETARGEPAQGLEKNTRTPVSLSSAFKSPTPIKQNTKPPTQGHATTRTVLSTVSLKNSLNISGKESNASTQASRSLPDLSALKISRALGASRSSNASVQKQTNSPRNLTQISELQGCAPSKLSPSLSKERQSQTSPSLKRKTYEGSSTDTLNIKPLKRFLPSPTASRNVKELVEGAKKEALYNVNISKRPNIDCYQSPTLDIARVVNSPDFNMPLVIESDDNVEKAEAYAKDLEDMCNMLKKKHEEAKELLVRAVVNNNNLLMLNHPIYEEKISLKSVRFRNLLCS